MLYENIEKLIQYGLKTGLIKEEDVSYSTNLLLDLFGQDDFEKPEVDTENLNLEEILKNLMDYAYKRKQRCIQRSVRHTHYELSDAASK